MAKSTVKIKAIDELLVLRQVAEKISSSLDLNDVLSHIVELAVDITSADSCLLYLYDKKREELTLLASKNPRQKMLGAIKLKMGEGITGFAAEKKKPYVITEGAYLDPHFKAFSGLPEDKFEAFLSIPIISKNELSGVINIQHKKKYIHPQEQIDLLFTIAGYLGSPIENARMYDETQKKAQQLDALTSISKSIVSDTYLKEILQFIVITAAQVTDSKTCTILLLDEKNSELAIAATQNENQEYIKKPNMKIANSLSGRAVREKRAIAVRDVSAEPGYKYPDIAKKQGFVSLLSVPMMVKGNVIGVVNVYTGREHSFTREETDLIRSIANQAAAAIESARLREEITSAKEALVVRKLVEKAKGLLMNEFKLSEEEAHKKIHKKSMDLGKSMKEIAEAIIMAMEIRK